MDWATLVGNLLHFGSSPTFDELASALFARGRHALESHGELAADSLLRQMDSERLMKAAQSPDWNLLQRRWEQARAELLDVDDVIALQAERALAEILNDRDRWHVRALGLRASGLPELADRVEAEVHRLDGFLEQYTDELGAISWMGEEARATAWDPASTAWSLVPLVHNEEPYRHPSAGDTRPIEDEELLLVVQELADPTLRHRISLALQQDESLRQRYEALLKDLDFVREAQRELVFLPVRKLLRGAPSAQPLEQRPAAATQSTPRYEIPGLDALVYTFEDGSELYAQKHDARWVLFLSRENPTEKDGFKGPVIEQFRQGENILIAIVRPGEVRVRYGNTPLSLQLDDAGT